MSFHIMTCTCMTKPPRPDLHDTYCPVRLHWEKDQLKKELGAAQAKIDRLMLEFCPDEMTARQIKTWEDNQRISEETLDGHTQS